VCEDFTVEYKPVLVNFILTGFMSNQANPPHIRSKNFRRVAHVKARSAPMSTPIYFFNVPKKQ